MVSEFLATLYELSFSIKGIIFNIQDLAIKIENFINSKF